VFELDKLSVDSSDSFDQDFESTDTKAKPVQAVELIYEANRSTPVLTPSSFLHSSIIATSVTSHLATNSSPLFPLNKFAPDQFEQLVLMLEGLDASNRAQLVELDPQRGTTPLHYAAQHGVDYVVKVLIKYFDKWGLLNRNWCDANGKTPVEIAIYENRLSTVKVFLKEMPSDSFVGTNGWQLLKAAVESNSVSMIEMLLDQGLDVNLTSELKESCLYMACRTQFIDGVELLLKRNADVNIAEISNGWTPLFITCVTGNEKIVSMLLEAKSSVCVLDRLGWTAMEHAGFRGFLKIAEMTKPDIVPTDTLTLNGPRGPSKSLSLSIEELSLNSQS
jgi:glycerophosphodiester phosphodiesterase